MNWIFFKRIDLTLLLGRVFGAEHLLSIKSRSSIFVFFAFIHVKE
ncbi:hypothetical protein B4064_1191 [Caldibacillus thermoamylovorans]|nr:hypothetical protein B4064_1191 [Caldibacillus thermoamylovorans]